MERLCKFIMLGMHSAGVSKADETWVWSRASCVS